jgi:hypothetical protein
VCTCTPVNYDRRVRPCRGLVVHGRRELLLRGAGSEKCWVGDLHIWGPGIRPNPPESDPLPNPSESRTAIPGEVQHTRRKNPCQSPPKLHLVRLIDSHGLNSRYWLAGLTRALAHALAHWRTGCTAVIAVTPLTSSAWSALTAVTRQLDSLYRRNKCGGALSGASWHDLSSLLKTCGQTPKARSPSSSGCFGWIGTGVCILVAPKLAY